MKEVTREGEENYSLSKTQGEKLSLLKMERLGYQQFYVLPRILWIASRFSFYARGVGREGRREESGKNPRI